ncbi:MAG: nucleotide exchange factor GrpE [Caldibacillus sp.]
MFEEKNIHNEELSEDKTEQESMVDEGNQKVNQNAGNENDPADQLSEEETSNEANKDDLTGDGEEKGGEQEVKDAPEQEDEVARLKVKIEELEKRLKEKENRLLRLQADFDNYRKRTRSEMEAFKKYRSQNLALELLSSLDNFERALKTDVQTEEGKAILKGMEMVYKSILAAFEKEGIKPIEAVGQQFDPNYHHAVMQDHNDEYEANIVTEELQKGYMIRDRVLRPSMVKVNQ